MHSHNIFLIWLWYAPQYKRLFFSSNVVFIIFNLVLIIKIWDFISVIMKTNTKIKLLTKKEEYTLINVNTNTVKMWLILYIIPSSLRAFSINWHSLKSPLIGKQNRYVIIENIVIIILVLRTFLKLSRIWWETSESNSLKDHIFFFNSSITRYCLAYINPVWDNIVTYKQKYIINFQTMKNSVTVYKNEQSNFISKFDDVISEKCNFSISIYWQIK